MGYGFASFGRFAQGGLIRERFAPRLLAAGGGLDPFLAWEAMMAGEKPGGHGERCVAVGALDMALWDASAKAAGLPLHRHLAEILPQARPQPDVAVYAAGGYRYPADDLRRLEHEARTLVDLGHGMLKIKVGAASLSEDVRRIEVVLGVVGDPARLAVDAMNAWTGDTGIEAARTLAPYRLRWLEDVGDPHDFEGLTTLAAEYDGPLAVGEALFSAAEARLLHRYGESPPGARHPRLRSRPLLRPPGLPVDPRASSRRPAGSGRPSGRMAATSSACTSSQRSGSVAPSSIHSPSSPSAG